MEVLYIPPKEKKGSVMAKKLKKPAVIAENAFKSAKWDEITKGHEFKDNQVPSLVTLCQWYSVLDRCTQDLDKMGGEVSYMNDYGDQKAVPQINIMKQASAEIRALNKQLGILAEIEEEEPKKKEKKENDTPLTLITGRRERKARAANS